MSIKLNHFYIFLLIVLYKFRFEKRKMTVIFLVGMSSILRNLNKYMNNTERHRIPNYAEFINN